jgi:SAM-dependent methyltransferase
MAHGEQMQYFAQIKEKFPTFFKGAKVLDIGALDINGCNRSFFEDCSYTGLDIGPGRNVDVVSLAHEYDAPDGSFDTVTSANAFEHDMHFEKTFKSMIRLVRDGGLLFFSCAGEGFREHGTARTNPADSPFTTRDAEWKDYYKNVTEAWVRSFVDIENTFESFEFSTSQACDQRFWGIKKKAV